MSTDPGLVRRVDRLENDTESVYELIGEFRDEFAAFRARAERRFDGIDTTLAESATRGDRVDATLTQIGTRLDQIDSTLTESATRADRVDATLTQIGTRFDQIDSTLAEVVRRLPEPT